MKELFSFIPWTGPLPRDQPEWPQRCAEARLCAAGLQLRTPGMWLDLSESRLETDNVKLPREPSLVPFPHKTLDSAFPKTSLPSRGEKEAPLIWGTEWFTLTLWVAQVLSAFHLLTCPQSHYKQSSLPSVYSSKFLSPDQVQVFNKVS